MKSIPILTLEEQRKERKGKQMSRYPNQHSGFCLLKAKRWSFLSRLFGSVSNLPSDTLWNFLQKSGNISFTCDCRSLAEEKSSVYLASSDLLGLIHLIP